MTPDQIRQIAEEYAEHKSPIADFINAYDKRDNLHEVYKEEAVKVLQYLAKRYCVVERSKVVEMHKHSHTECFMPTTCLDREFARGKCNVMESLFGSETFNKNKE